MDKNKEFVNEEKTWWQNSYKRQSISSEQSYRGSPERPQGIRHYYREMIIRPIRSIIKNSQWVDIGAGNSYSIVDLVNPDKFNYFYYATDISIEGLKLGRARTGRTPIISEAASPPFVKKGVDIVSCFGILHHIPDWEQALCKMIDLLKPGGYLLLFEAITKPRILSRWRHQSYTAKSDSPHEGDIISEKLIEILHMYCNIEVLDYSGSPLRLGFSGS